MTNLLPNPCKVVFFILFRKVGTPRIFWRAMSPLIWGRHTPFSMSFLGRCFCDPRSPNRCQTQLLCPWLFFSRNNSFLSLCPWKSWAIVMTYVGFFPPSYSHHPVIVTTRILTCLVGDSPKNLQFTSNYYRKNGTAQAAHNSTRRIQCSSQDGKFTEVPIECKPFSIANWSFGVPKALLHEIQVGLMTFPLILWAYDMKWSN